MRAARFAAGMEPVWQCTETGGRLINFFKWLLTILICLHLFSGCASFGPTKPNTPYSGPYPESFKHIFSKNPLLAKELGKLPSFQDGFSEAELQALQSIITIYVANENEFNVFFNKIYIIGIPEYRKYCTALEAFFWLIVDGKTDIAIKILTDYSLSDLLDASWNYTSNFFDCDDRIMPVVESIKDNQLKLEYLNDLKQKNYERIQVGLFSDYFINRDIFTQNGQKQIKSALRYVKKNERWGSPKIILDRLMRRYC